MGRKNQKRSNAGSSSSNSSGGAKNTSSTTPVWTAADHAERNAAAAKRTKTAWQERRRAILSHETKEKRDDLKLKLHITRVQRELEALQSRLEAWDPVDEEKKKQEEEERQRKEAEAANEPPTKKRRKRPGPETWKLKGAARPAWEVYNFDTRYVDPHIKAHEEAKEKARRSINVLVLHKGKLATEGPEPAREYLSLLMELGYLNEDARKYKSARAAWKECMELEGENPITTARESLMRLYLKVNKPDDALKLGQSLMDDQSVWIRYSLALVAFRKDHEQAVDYICSAIKANPLCAYYLAFLDVFQSTMEYTHELEESDNEPESSLEEAIEYCTSGQEKGWRDSGADVKLREILLRSILGQEDRITQSDVDWDDRLNKLEEELARRQRLRHVEEAGYYGPGVSDEDGDTKDVVGTTDEDGDTKDAVGTTDEDQQESEKGNSGTDEQQCDDLEGETEGSGENDNEDEGELVDVLMYIGMFRTAMEMVEEEGFAVSVPKKG